MHPPRSTMTSLADQRRRRRSPAGRAGRRRRSRTRKREKVQALREERHVDVSGRRRVRSRWHAARMHMPLHADLQAGHTAARQHYFCRHRRKWWPEAAQGARSASRRGGADSFMGDESRCERAATRTRRHTGVRQRAEPCPGVFFLRAAPWHLPCGASEDGAPGVVSEREVDGLKLDATRRSRRQRRGSSGPRVTIDDCRRAVALAVGRVSTPRWGAFLSPSVTAAAATQVANFCGIVRKKSTSKSRIYRRTIHTDIL